MSGDRTVHAVLPGHRAIVRYNVTSRWFLEYVDPDNPVPTQITDLTVKEAAHMALDEGGQVFLNRKGGARFDKIYTTLYQQKMAELRKEKS